MSLDFSLLVDPCPTCGHAAENLSFNITHNLAEMAGAAGIYQVLWRPDEHGYTHARDIIEALERGVTDMKLRPQYYAQFDSSNGWGTYPNLLAFATEVLDACKRHPDARIEVWR